MAEKFTPQHTPCPWKTMAGKCRSPLSASLRKIFDELMRSNWGVDEKWMRWYEEEMRRQWVALLAYYKDLLWYTIHNIYLNATASANVRRVHMTSRFGWEKDVGRRRGRAGRRDGGAVAPGSMIGGRIKWPSSPASPPPHILFRCTTQVISADLSLSKVRGCLENSVK